MANSSEQLAEALESVASGAETNTAETEVEALETTATKGSKGDKTIPYTRFQEVIGQKNDLQARLEAIANERSELSKSLAEVTPMLKTAQENSQTLEAIRNLHSNPRYKDAVELIHKALIGEDAEEVEAVEKIINDPEVKVEDKLKAAQDLLQKSTDKLEEQNAEVFARQILGEADRIADRYLDALPEEYNDKDRELIAKEWTAAIPWNDVEADPDQLGSILHDTFQAVVTDYGNPRGALELQLAELQRTQLDEDGNLTTTSKSLAPEEELAQILQKDFGALKAVKLPSGKEVMKPEISDEDFTRDFARVLKIHNAAKR